MRQLVAAGIIRPDERVVCVLTGNMLKDPDAIVLAREAAGWDGITEGTEALTEATEGREGHEHPR